MLYSLHVSNSHFVNVCDVTAAECSSRPFGETEDAEDLASLVGRARQGDLKAYEGLIRAHEKPVLRLAWRLMGNVEDAQDVAQEVFLKMYRSLGTFDDLRDFRPWLNRVTANACMDALRRRKAAMPVSSLAEMASVGNPESDVGGEERRRILHAALQQLPDKQREALVLRDLEGLSTAEVADSLGATPATIRSHIAQARVRLRKILQPFLGERYGM